MVHGEQDFTVRAVSSTDETHIKGVVFRDPTIPASKPVSIENPAIAYDPINDRFKGLVYGSEGLPVKQEAVTGKLQCKIL